MLWKINIVFLSMQFFSLSGFLHYFPPRAIDTLGKVVPESAENIQVAHLSGEKA